MTKLDWMHPSYRDLMIDELVADKELRKAFLQTANMKDIGLALSNQGGEKGKRSWPLIVDDDSRRLIEQRISEIIPDLEIYEQLGLFYILESSIKEKGSDKDWISSLLYQVLILLRNQWQGKPTNLSLLKEFCKSSLVLKPLPQLPDFESTWNYQIDLIRNVIREENFFSRSEIGNWAELLTLLEKNEPRFLIQVNFPSDYSSLVSEIIQNMESDINSYILSPSKDVIRNEIDRINEIINGLDELASFESSFRKMITPIISSLEQKRDEYAESIQEEENPEITEIDDEPITPSDFDIDRLFSDL